MVVSSNNVLSLLRRAVFTENPRLPQHSHAQLEDHKETTQSIILTLLAIWHLTG